MINIRKEIEDELVILAKELVNISITLPANEFQKLIDENNRKWEFVFMQIVGCYD